MCVCSKYQLYVLCIDLGVPRIVTKQGSTSLVSELREIKRNK